MESPFSFHGILPFFWIGALMVAGMLAVRAVPWLSRYLVPACLVAGVIGFLLTNLGVTGVEGTAFESWAYHLFNLSFISLGLTGREDASSGRASSGEALVGAGWMALTQGAVFGLQAAVAGLIVLGFQLSGTDLFAGFGLLLPLGFEEGPGQALSLGKVWEEFGWRGATDVGLAFAALGFLVALLVGIPLINWMSRSGQPAGSSPDQSGDAQASALAAEQGEDALGTVGAEGLVRHLSAAALVYFVTYLSVDGLSGILPTDAGKIIWGFTFLIGLGIATMARVVMARTGLERQFHPALQRRVTGASVDFLVVATFCAISFPVLEKFLVPVAVVTLAGAATTAIAVFWLGGWLWDRRLERSAAIFGTVTGTAATGLLLLRITDPGLRTGVASELAVMNILSIAVIGPCLFLVNAPVWWDVSLPVTVAAFAGVSLVCLGGIVGLGRWRRRVLE
jgi:ESS family glutamate:Na+ symporter